MRKILLLLIFIPLFTFGQNKSKKPAAKKKTEQVVIKEDPTKETFLKEKDFVTDSTGVHGDRRTILVKDGSENIVTVPFLFSSPKDKFQTVGLQQINMMIHMSNFKTMLKMKNKYTYQPRKLSVFYSNDRSEWTCAVEYTSQNDYGAMKNGTIFYKYDDSGNFVDSLGGY